jgi:hypothetical protein
VLVVLHPVVHEIEINSHSHSGLVNLAWDSWQANAFNRFPLGEIETQLLNANFKVTELDLALEILHCIIFQVT